MLAGGESFELSIDVLQAIEIKRVRGATFLCSGTFSEISVTDSGPSSAVDFWRGSRIGSKADLTVLIPAHHSPRPADGW